MSNYEKIKSILEHGNYCKINNTIFIGISDNGCLITRNGSVYSEKDFDNSDKITPIPRPIKLMKEGDKCVILEGKFKGKKRKIVEVSESDYRVEHIDEEGHYYYNYFPLHQVAPYFEEEDENIAGEDFKSGDLVHRGDDGKFYKVKKEDETEKLIKEYVKNIESHEFHNWEGLLRNFAEELKKKGD